MTDPDFEVGRTRATVFSPRSRLLRERTLESKAGMNERSRYITRSSAQKDERRVEKEERPARWQPVRRVFDRLALTVGPRTTFAGTTVPSHTSSHSNRARALSRTLPSIPGRSVPRTPTIRNLECFVIHGYSRTCIRGMFPEKFERPRFFGRNRRSVKRKPDTGFASHQSGERNLHYRAKNAEIPAYFTFRRDIRAFP